MSRAYYSASIPVFLKQDPSIIMGKLTNQPGFAADDLLRYSWKKTIEILRTTLEGLIGTVYLEFSIPRMGKRVDAILLASGIVFIIEFKVGKSGYSREDLEQVMDYALDLKNFHETSHGLPIVPILLATHAEPEECVITRFQDDVFQPIKSNESILRPQLDLCLRKIPNSQIIPDEWENGRYKPTPTIIEAAQALYQGHNIKEISRSDAGAINLSETSEAVYQIINQAKRNREKAICFITGVPGAGKTLAGLNIANSQLQMGEDEHSVFLSGNGPLVNVLREALVREEMDKDIKRKDAARKAEVFIQNIHHFRDEYYEKPIAPPDRVVVFDEAQRAWTGEMTAQFMKKKRGVVDFSMSEPEFLIHVMDRHPDWAVIICLIGGGQEINTGEAGLKEWFVALQQHFPKWKVYVSRQLKDAEYLSGQDPEDIILSTQLQIEDRLHLAVSVRSYRSEKVSALIKAVLDCELDHAKELYSLVKPHYPIYLTCDISVARNWVRERARGSERFGLLASSGGLRLRPEGVFVKADIEVEQWFLNDRDDVRSSFALEGNATEFDIQGLELDWTIVAWDADLRYFINEWQYRSFKGSKWQTVNDTTRRLYLKNSYRVLLTRARQGMIIFIPKGDAGDPTRLPIFYEGTYEYLKLIGLPII